PEYRSYATPDSGDEKRYGYDARRFWCFHVCWASDMRLRCACFGFRYYCSASTNRTYLVLAGDRLRGFKPRSAMGAIVGLHLCLLITSDRPSLGGAYRRYFAVSAWVCRLCWQ